MMRSIALRVAHVCKSRLINPVTYHRTEHADRIEIAAIFLCHGAQGKIGCKLAQHFVT